MIFKRSKPRLTPVTKTEVVKRLLDMSVVRVGSGDRLVLVFFDLKCPFCSRLFRDTEDILLELANKGVLTYAMCDYVVHKDAEPLHRALRCLSHDERLKFIREVFSGGRVELRDCTVDGLDECEKAAEELGIYGTPTLLFYNFTKGRGYIHFGYMKPEEVIEALGSL
ncbi:MAG: thioredoxin fold domain-containing protein [Pyrobaculum sp.]